MHALQPKVFKLKSDDVDKLLDKLNIALSQLPKISKLDPQVPKDTDAGNVLRFARKTESGEQDYFRVVV